MILVETNLQGLVLNDAVNVAGQMVQDFKRKIAKRLLGALDPLARVGLCKGNAEVLANRLRFALIRRPWDIHISSFGKSIKELDAFA